jgi:hypothetical protein
MRGTYRDSVGITAKELDVLLNPFVGHLLIHQADVEKPSPMSKRRRQETKSAESVVDRDTDKILRRVANHRRDVEGSSSTGIKRSTSGSCKPEEPQTSR